jgi:hypothetical protein
MKRKTYVILSAAVLILAALFAVEYAGTAGAATGTVQTVAGLTFHDVAAQTRELIAYDDSIELTPAQEAVRVEALSAIPAPCCSQYSAATCCCPCNMAKAVWGLSKYLITEKGADVAQVRQAAQDWFGFINPNGFTGDACFTGGCGRAFKANGCGGMSKDNPVF